MKPVVLVGGSFLLWVAARGRWPKYSSLVHKSDATPPSGGATATASSGSPSPVDAVAGTVHDIFARVWDSFKQGK